MSTRARAREPVATWSDEALVGAAVAEDQAALAEIYRRYWKLVHAAVLARVPAAEVEDLVQDVFIAATRRLDTVRSGEALGGWLLTIARHRAVDYWRRTKAAAELPEDLGQSDPPSAEANQILARIRELPDAYRETLILRLVLGMTGPEIAERTGMTHGSVRTNLFRGMKLLRDSLSVTVEDV